MTREEVKYRLDAECGLLCRRIGNVPAAWDGPSKEWAEWDDTAIRVMCGMDSWLPCSKEQAEEIMKNGYKHN